MFMEKPFLVGYFTKCLVKEKTLGLISDNLGDLFMTVFPLMVSCKLDTPGRLPYKKQEGTSSFYGLKKCLWYLFGFSASKAYSISFSSTF